ncbi:hypothetical protein [Achromobacter sp.]|uniref:hypothetical protein n=1 Tax=Achromobacter sp. TaxID=134375 RepID=UPI00258FCFAF|nr:hypothetical protein [Achromobacter sp.]
MMLGVKDCPVTVDQDGNGLTPTPPKIDLRDAQAIRREMAVVYRDMRSGKMETQDGTRLVYVLDMIRKAYETGILEERITQLERIGHGNP